MGFELQHATTNDAEAISDLDCAVFPEEGMGPSVIRQEISLGWAVVALDQSEVVGYALVRPGSISDLTRLGVRESHRGKGIGQALLNACIVHNKGPMMLLVRKNNKPALDMYLKTGFTIAGTKETSWLMMKL